MPALGKRKQLSMDKMSAWLGTSDIILIELKGQIKQKHYIVKKMMSHCLNRQQLIRKSQLRLGL